MYTCDDDELSGGVQTMSAFDVKDMIAAQAARAKAAKANRGQDQKFAAGAGTPLGRAFRKLMK